MALKKSELYSSLWKSCDQLRGSMDASQYKDYVLVLLFVKYVSDRYAGHRYALIDVPAGGSFADMVALKGDKEIGDKMNKIIGRLAEANDLKGVIDVADFNDADKLGRGKAMVDRLSNLVAIFNTPALNFRSNRADGDDLLGDAYEYLMRHFATESGKSKGQFYTPAEASMIMSRVIDLGKASSSAQSLYDPTCGSGSLLLKAHDLAQSRTGLDLAIYGQEMDNATRALARMNMILHDCPTAEIWQDNTLSDPHFRNADGTLKTFDYVVANVPFSWKAWSSGFDPANDVYDRFAYGIPPAKNGDYAFLLHILASLKSTGKGAVILPHGVLFRGGAEGAIRTRIVQRGYIKGIIGLPANLFYGTGIPACILVLDKEEAATRQGIFMIDASRGFMKDGAKNRLRSQDIHKIVDTFNNGIEIERYSRMVPFAEIEANDYNLNIPRYIDSTEPEDLHDLEAHMRGGIPERDIEALDEYWSVFPGLRDDLFVEDRPGYYLLRGEPATIRSTIFEHPEFTAFKATVTGLFEEWRETHRPELAAIAPGDPPSALIGALAEDLLATFHRAPLLDPYDVYQHLMDYWAEVMQDDVFMLVQDGWTAMTEGQPNTNLIPRSLVIARFFATERAAIDAMEAEHEALSRQIEELDEEHGGEDGLLADAKSDTGKLTAKSAKDRLKEVGRNPDAEEERILLKSLLALIEQESEAKKKIRVAVKNLDTRAAARYQTLDVDQVRTLVIDDKWLTALASEVQGELDRVSQGLACRVRHLAERYQTPLPLLAEEADALSARVEDHMRRMGVAWN